MTKEKINRISNEEEPQREVFQDAKQARQALTSLWHKDVNPDKLKEKLSEQDQENQKGLIEHGHEMTALLNLNSKVAKEGDRDINHIRFVSGNTTKLEVLEKSLENKNAEILSVSIEDIEHEEQKAHQFLQKIIDEYKNEENPRNLVRIYTPDFYSIDVAEEKARAVAKNYPNESILASDVVVLLEGEILEKPKNRTEAEIMLSKISGKEIRISSGSILINTIKSGETILTREGVIIKIKLNQYSEKDIDEYLNEFKEYESTAGSIDYSHPASQKLIADEYITIEKLDVETSEPPKQVLINKSLLLEMRDYCIGMPTEMLREMIDQAQNLS